MILIAVVFAGCESKSVTARNELHTLGVEFNPRTYYKHVGESDIVVVKLFLDAGMPPNSEDALNSAVGCKNISMVKLLIKYGAKPTGEDLYDAIYDENFDMSKLLLENGVDPNSEDCVYSAISDGNIEIIKLLIQSGLKINQLHKISYNNKKFLPLAYALDREEYEIAGLLIDHGGTLEEWTLDGVPMVEIYAEKIENIQSNGVR